MQSIDHFNLRSFDLNLLVAFDALMSERSVTKAAQRLKLGQPAMSHALASLRLLLDDEFLVRVGTVMEPTAKAIALAPRLRELLLQIQSTLTADAPFDPKFGDQPAMTDQDIQDIIAFMKTLTSELDPTAMPVLPR